MCDTSVYSGLVIMWNSVLYIRNKGILLELVLRFIY
jgi:hypothetical protein